MGMTEFQDVLRPLVEALQGLDLSDPAAASAALAERLPFEGDLVASVRAATLAGAEEGWLLPRENGPIRYGRVTKDLLGFSVDAVRMETPGPKHRHPNGEVDLCFATRDDPRFDGQPEGWVVFPPGSVHVPTVAGGEMLILYFLPGGAMEFL